MSNPIEVATQAIRRALERCRAADDEHFQLELKLLINALERSPFLSRAAVEVKAGGATELGPIIQEQEAIRRSLIDCRTQFAKYEPKVELGGSPMGRIYSLRKFDQLIAQGEEAVLPDLSGTRYKDLSVERELCTILKGQIEAVPQESRDEDWERLRREVRSLMDRVNRNFRERLNVLRSHPAVCLHEMLARVAKLNPHGSPYLDELSDMERQKAIETAFEEVVRTYGGPPFEKILYGQGSNIQGQQPTKEELDAFQAWRSSLEKGLPGLVDELEYRLGMGASRLEVLRRYGRRSERYRREELVARLQDGTGAARRQSEKVLVADAATYIYDQGFEVLTEIQLGVVRLDVIADDPRERFLLEAKIYGEGRGGRAALKAGLLQLMDYARRLRESSGEVIPALLLFRLSGPPVDVPEFVDIGDHRFLIIHIDLASSRESGSRAQPPEVLNADDVRQLVATRDGSSDAETHRGRHCQPRRSRNTRK